jgi:6-pyruvoyltetrahydropterin/6-carboxytetrahydropterin synthase
LPYNTKKATLCLTFRWEGAHSLPNHQGKCKRVHGHNYRMDVSLRGEVEKQDNELGKQSEKGRRHGERFSPTLGMIAEFDDVKGIIDAFIDEKVDHRFMNDVVSEEFHPVTTENVAYWMFSELYGKFGDILNQVRVWETDRSNAYVTLEDFQIYQETK